MIKVTLISVFRNSEKYMMRYLEQLQNLLSITRTMKWQINILWGEGDSTDLTRTLLIQNKLNGANTIKLVDVSHGGKEYGSVIDGQRFKQLAYVANRMWDRIPADTDIILWVESDLVWGPHTIIEMIRQVYDKKRNTYEVMFPMVFLNRTGWKQKSFYDTWAFRADGINFGHSYPYHSVLVDEEYFADGTTIDIDSGGSCFAMRGELKNLVEFDERLIVGMCDDLRDEGHLIWLDTALEVIHE